MKPTKKKPAKRNYRKSNPIVHKLIDLKYRINDMYRNGGPGVDGDDTRIDKSWVMCLINDVREDGFEGLCKEDMLKCNGLWIKYA